MDEKTNVAVDKTLAFDVAIKDKNDNAPKFEPANIRISVRENTPPGMVRNVLFLSLYNYYSIKYYRLS